MMGKGIGVGQVCYKTAGRRAGKKVIVVGFEKKTMRAIIQGEAESVRACNISHLWPTGETVAVKTLLENVPEKKVIEKPRQEKKGVKQRVEQPETAKHVQKKSTAQALQKSLTENKKAIRKKKAVEKK